MGVGKNAFFCPNIHENVDTLTNNFQNNENCNILETFRRDF